MKAIHLKCERENGKLKGLTPIDRQSGRYRSCCWDISEAEAQELVGGWVYFHGTKNTPSEFGGKIINFEAVQLADKAHSIRYALILQARVEARNQTWRGQDHSMAWTGRAIDAKLPHEVI